MIQTIAETAWHHEGDFIFMCNLVKDTCSNTNADYVKLHITLDLDEYMSKDHHNYQMLKTWMFNENEWSEIIAIIRFLHKRLLLISIWDNSAMTALDYAIISGNVRIIQALERRYASGSNSDYFASLARAPLWKAGVPPEIFKKNYETQTTYLKHYPTPLYWRGRSGRHKM